MSERPGLRTALLADVEEIGVAEAWSEPGGPSPPPHLHRRHVESFYVLEGELTFTAAAVSFERRPGRGCRCRRACRTFAFPGDRAVRFLNVHTPSCGFGAFLRGLDEARTDDELAAVRAAFDQTPA